MSLPYRQLTSNTLIQWTERVFGIGLGIATIAVLTRLLEVETFGTYSTIIVILQFAASITDLGLGLTLSQLIAEPNANRARILGAMIPLRVVTSVVAAIAAIAISNILGYPGLVPLGVAVASGSFVALQLSQMLHGYFRAELAMTAVAAIELFQRFLYLLFLLTLTGNQREPMLLPVLWGGTIVQLLALLALLVLLRRRVTFSWQWDSRMIALILRKNLPLSLSMLATLIYFKADTVILSLYRSAGEVGLYSAPYRLLETLVNLPHVTLSLVLPLASAAWAKHDCGALRSLAQWSFTTTLALALPMLIGGLLLAKPLMVAIAGSSFAASGDILKILLAATFAIMIGTQSAYLVLATNRQRRMLPWYLLAAAGALFSYLLLIPIYGYWAAAWTTLAVETLMAIANIALAARALPWLPDKTQTARIAGATVIMAITLLFTRNASVFFSLPLGIAVYGFSLLGLGFHPHPPAETKTVV